MKSSKNVFNLNEKEFNKIKDVKISDIKEFKILNKR